MGLYVSITLLATLTITGDGDGNEDVLAIVWGTTIGLALAHWFAFDLVVRLVVARPLPGHATQELAAELAGALVVAALATAAVLLSPAHLERQAVRLAMVGLVGLVTFAEARAFGASWARAASSGVIAVVIAAIIAAIKYQLTH